MTHIPAAHEHDPLGLAGWPSGDRQRGWLAVGLATSAYAGHRRDQGTPYLDHPVRVVAVLRRELLVRDPDTLILGLLHDALEISPAQEPLIATRLGTEVVERLRAMTPDHRLEAREKRPDDTAAWLEKLATLGPTELLVRFADRVDNLRDLQHSPDPERRMRFLKALDDTYLPMAAAARDISPHHRLAHDLLLRELRRHQRARGLTS